MELFAFLLVRGIISESIPTLQHDLAQELSMHNYFSTVGSNRVEIVIKNATVPGGTDIRM